MRCNCRPLPLGSICRSKTLAFTAFWSMPESRLKDEVKVSAIRKFTLSHPEYLHNLVAKVIDDFHCDATARGPRERTRGVGIERRPGLLVDLRLERCLEALVGVVRAQEIGVADEEALLVVVGVDEPGGDAVGIVRADGARIGVEHVDTVDLDADFRPALVE